LDHFSARLRAAGLEEAKMSCRHRRFGGELELAQPTNLAPMTKQAAKVARWDFLSDEVFRRFHET
jgi:hypothetical protein